MSMTEKNILATKNEQQIVQKDSAAADCWKPGTTDARSDQGASGTNGHKAVNAASSEKLSALGFPKTDITADLKNHAPDTLKFAPEEHLLSAGDKVKANYDAKSHTSPEKQAHDQKLTHQKVDEKLHKPNHATGHDDAKEHVKSAGHKVKTGHHHHSSSNAVVQMKPLLVVTTPNVRIAASLRNLLVPTENCTHIQLIT
jgi:hypothetical protein